ncbi:MAG: carboxypeptidase-like regulatory domain-containing protein [Bacteroidota bacterium]
MRFYIFISLLSTLLLCHSSCREETIAPKLFGSVVGVVLLDSDENIAIENARVSTNPATTSVVTDSLGRFTLDSIEVNTYTLRIEKTGFNTELEGVSIIEDRTLNVIVRMRPDSLDNTPPLSPNTPQPSDGTTTTGVEVVLRWEASDSDNDDELRYDVLLYRSSSVARTLVAERVADNNVTVSDLAYGETYFWQVIATDGQDEVNGPIWSFQTPIFPEHRFLYTRLHDTQYDIYSSDGMGNEIRLTSGNNSSWRPRMNPQRNKIAFISNAGIATHIYTMNRDGSDVRQVTTIPISGGNLLELDFCWSPDGAELLYMDGDKLYRIHADGTGLEQVAVAAVGYRFTTCDWTAQDNKLVVRTTGSFNHDSEIYTMDTSGTVLQRIITDAPGSIGGASFSVDGQQLLYTQDVSGFEDISGRQLDTRVFLYDLNTLTTMDISEDKPDGTNDIDVRFSPDGAKIIFVNTSNDGISQRNIYAADVEESFIDDRVLLFENAEMPEWR